MKEFVVQKGESFELIIRTIHELVHFNEKWYCEEESARHGL